MHMHIHETGEQTTMIKFNNTGVGNNRSFLGNGNNTAVVYENRDLIGRAVPEHRHLIQKKFHFYLPPLFTHNVRFYLSHGNRYRQFCQFPIP